ncbi:hypothetical protein Q7P37_010845 [Cladosporium fusiforme]
MHAFVPFVALLGLAAAQSETTSSAASGTSSSTDPTATCLAACKSGDVNCQAQCVNVPFPDEAQIDATLQCSTNECSQGDSGPEDTKKYGECLASCASDFYYVSGGTPTGVATARSSATDASTPNNSSAQTTTGSDSDASSTGSASQTGSSSDDSESGASSTASEAAASATGSESDSADAAESTGAASALTVTLSGGVVGLVVAALAL